MSNCKKSQETRCHDAFSATSKLQMTLCLVILFVAALSNSAIAEVNRCVDQRGAVTFQQQPCSRPDVPSSNAQAALARDKAQRQAESVQNRKAVAASLEAQLEAAKKRRAAEPLVPAAATARVSSSSQPMSFEQCKQAVGRTVLALGPAAIQNTRFLVSSTIVTVTRICTVEGSVLITCSAPDGTMVTTQSPDC
jgi:hypothetical protein